MFVWDAKDLNDEQVAAIEEPGSVFLTACPGSGKTRTLTYKIARELSLLTSEKKRLVAITYTHRAADEIHERIEQLGVDTSQLWIGTIHSFCLEWILKPYALYHDALKFGFRVINAHDSDRKFEALCQAATTNLSIFDCKYYFTPRGAELSCFDHKRAAVEALLTKYWADLRANRQLDFELILYYAYELIMTVPSINTLLGSLFASILVDEYQDTKEIQYEILAAILKAGKGQASAFIVGDPNQAIYGSLGGHAIDPGDFGTRCGLVFKEMDLSRNYRSSARIVGYFGNYNLLAPKIEAVGKNKNYQSLISFDHATHRDDLEAELVRLLRHNIEVDGISPQEICIVAPQWVHLASMTRRLVAALPEYDFDGPGMIPFARDIDNFWYKLSRIVLTEASPQLYVQRTRWAGDVLAALADAGIDISNMSRKSLLRACNTISLPETDGLAYLRRFFEVLFEAIGIDRTASPSLVEHYNDFFESSEARVQYLARDGSAPITELAMFRKVFAHRTGITVSTIHGIKGAEYDAVIAYGLLEGMVPHFNDTAPGSAHKLLYVICSRARKNLHLLSERARGRGGNRPDYTPTEILLKCPFPYNSVP